MGLSFLSLKNVRKHTDTKISFADGLNYIVGGNGLGKTTILEAIYYICTTKSCCSKSDTGVVKFKEDSFEITGVLEGLTTDNVVINYSVPAGKKQYYLNEKLITKPLTVIGKFPVVLLSPADHSITQGFPAERRKFVDSVISQTSRTYLELLLEYQKVLKHRSALLSRIRDGYKDSGDELNAWNQKLISCGGEIIQHRQKFSVDFMFYINESYNRIMQGSERPAITYLTLENHFNNDIQSRFIILLDQLRNEEIRKAANLVGPHRDEFIFEINGLNLREFGSQGQHKTFQAALRLAEFFYIKDITGTTPIFLLDDVFGELDAERTYKVSEYLGEIGQAFITLTDFGNLSLLKLEKNDKIIKLTSDSQISYA